MRNDPVTSSAVRRYYEQNTGMMLRFGSSPQARTIHRALWPPEVHTLDEALHYSHRLLHKEIEQLTPASGQTMLHIADLGCGVGASLRYLLSHLQRPTTAVGITISATQARLAQKQIQGGRVQHRCAVVEGDFLAVPLGAGFDAVYSIEAFSHSPSALGYLTQAARLLRPGGRLMLIDDFLAQDRWCDHEWVKAYQKGWFVPNVQTVATIATLAQQTGLQLVAQRDLTPLLHLRALPDAIALTLLHVGQRLPIQHTLLPSSLGSMALQQCLQSGLTQYRWLVFERDST